MGLSVGIKGRERSARGRAEGCELAAVDQGGRAGQARHLHVVSVQGRTLPQPAGAWWRGSTGAKAFGLGWDGRV